MQIRILLVVLLLGLSLPAGADSKVDVKAYEVAVSDLRLPGSVHGTLSFKQCSDCSYVTALVTEATVYATNNEGVSLEDFRKSLEGIADPGNKHLTVMRNLKTNTIAGVYITF